MANFTFKEAVRELRALCFPDKYLEEETLKKIKKNIKDTPDLDKDRKYVLMTVLSYVGRTDLLGWNEYGAPVFAVNYDDDDFENIEYTGEPDTRWGEGYSVTEDGTSIF